MDLCNKLISPTDTEIPQFKTAVLAQIKGNFLYIYSKKPISISKIVELADSFRVPISDVVSYRLEGISVYKFTPAVQREELGLISPSNSKTQPDQFDDSMELKSPISQNQSPSPITFPRPELLQIIEKALTGELPERCQLYYLIRKGLTLREMWLLKGLIKYESQLILEYSEHLITETIIQNYDLVFNIIDYFQLKFDPNLDSSSSLNGKTVKNGARRQSYSTTSKDHPSSPKNQPSSERFSQMEKLERTILEQLKQVKGLTEDRILRLLFWIVKGMVRTNYYLKKETISFKFHLPTFWHFLNGIQPVWEGFVFHSHFYGLHLRMSKVSRGGLRWSNRYEDLREEIKSLMITQEGKNAIIVPEGAKGGFVILEKKVSKERFKEIYRLFIDGLLDLIDVDHNSIPIVKYDKRDFYFVVAADKGTAHMSDTANQIAVNRGYFFRDAFASGGSKGYNHKELGVTAKGAIKSAQRHFLEIGKDIYSDPIKVVGVGSMRGDVFGNGMLINPNFLLVGAISHREIFIDPNPDPKIAYLERFRLFKEGLGWGNYNPDKISPGGGVFPRDAKSIPISPQIQQLLQTDKTKMSGEELVRALLTAPVELLYFGGIGTYVKSSDETNQEVGDKENEGVRINGDQLRAFAICEGANLALTPRGRVEYAKRGGRLNMDAIDNSAGVNTSDYEVNLKILLNRLVDEGKLTEIEKDEILFSLTNWVMGRVFSNNYHQSLIISLDQLGVKRTELLKILNILEKHIKFFKRKQFAIPKNEEIEGILKDGNVVRPVLAILLLYSKILLKKGLLEGSFIDSPTGNRFFNRYFPPILQNFDHPLRREITATAISNYIINRTGIRFIRDYEPTLLDRKVECYLLMDQLIGAEEIRKEIWSLDLKMRTEEQYALLSQIEESLYFATKWLLKHYDRFKNISQIGHYRDEVREFFQQKRLGRFSSPTLDTFFNWSEYYKFLPSAIYLKEQTGRSLREVMEGFRIVLNRFKIEQVLQLLRKIKSQDEIIQSLKKEAREIIEYFVINVSQQLIRKGGGLENYQEIERLVGELKEDLNSILHLTNRMGLILLSEK